MLKLQRLFWGRCSRACRTGMQLLSALALTWAWFFCLGFFFFLRQIIFIDFHEISVRIIQKYFTWVEDKRYGSGTCITVHSTCWLSPGTVQKILKQRLTMVQFLSANFLTPAQCKELAGGPSPATAPFLSSTIQMYGWVWNVIIENILSRAGDSPKENKQHREENWKDVNFISLSSVDDYHASQILWWYPLLEQGLSTR